MPDNDYQANQFRSYKTVVSGLSLGFVDTASGGYTPALGEVLQYDGTTVVLKDGREFSKIPQLRSAINDGWLVPCSEASSGYRPKSAGISVRDPQQRGSDRVARRPLSTVGDDERFVSNIDDRRVAREKTNADATQRVPLESAEARRALLSEQRTPLPVTSHSDPDLDEVLEALDAADEKWVSSKREPDKFARAEADIIALLNSVAEQEVTPRVPQLAPRRSVPAPTPEPALRQSARSLPVDRDESLRMPLVREDPTENSGVVVGTVSNASRIVVDREREVDIDVAPASPRNQSPAPRPRFGGSGVVVVDEERDMGTIAFSSNAQAPIRLAEHAQVASSASSDMVRMGDVEVGRRKTAAERAPSSGIDGGVTVGRILSPTVSRTVVSDSNASVSAIERTEQGKPVRIERFASGATATGDVQEARSGDELEDLLPDAVSPPEVYRPEAEDPAFAAVRMLVPDFSWDRDRPVKEKVAEALKHVKNPLFVKGILAVESNLVREEIKKALDRLRNPGALEK